MYQSNACITVLCLNTLEKENLFLSGPRAQKVNGKHSKFYWLLQKMMSILQQYKQYLPYYHIVNEYVEITAKSFDKYLSEIIICLF